MGMILDMQIIYLHNNEVKCVLDFGSLLKLYSLLSVLSLFGICIQKLGYWIFAAGALIVDPGININ